MTGAAVSASAAAPARDPDRQPLIRWAWRAATTVALVLGGLVAHLVISPFLHPQVWPAPVSRIELTGSAHVQLVIDPIAAPALEWPFADVAPQPDPKGILRLARPPTESDPLIRLRLPTVPEIAMADGARLTTRSESTGPWRISQTGSSRVMLQGALAVLHLQGAGSSTCDGANATIARAVVRLSQNAQADLPRCTRLGAALADTTRLRIPTTCLLDGIEITSTAHLERR